MNRREFIKFSGAGIFTLFLSGCGLSMLPGENTDNAKAATNIEGENMKIVVITGSPHRNGTSALLADKFIEGAQSVGHTVYRFNAAFEGRLNYSRLISGAARARAVPFVCTILKL